MSAIILDNEIVHYEVLGRGRPVVFLHGWVGSWRYWIPSMQAVSTSYRAYALDFWGYGGSAKDASRYLLSNQIELVNQFLYELGMGKVALIGHGLGAVVALLFAEKYPQQVDRLMAISMPMEAGLVSPRLQQLSPQELAEWLLGATPETEAARAEAPRADKEAILRTLNTLRLAEITQLPNRLRTPCLLVNGLEDPAVGHPSSARLDQLPDHMHHITFNRSGHFPMLDQPAKFNRLMIDFLSLVSGNSPTQLQLKEEWVRRLR